MSVRPFCSSTKSFSDSDEIWYVEVDEWCTTVCRMTRSKVKVTRPLKLEILFLQFSKSISSGIFNVSWQLTTDSETTEQYLTFVRSRFLISVLVFVSRDYELGIGWHWFSLQMLLQSQLHSLGGGGVRRRPHSRMGLTFLLRSINNE